MRPLDTVGTRVEIKFWAPHAIDAMLSISDRLLDGVGHAASTRRCSHDRVWSMAWRCTKVSATFLVIT